MSIRPQKKGIRTKADFSDSINSNDSTLPDEPYFLKEELGHISKEEDEEV